MPSRKAVKTAEASTDGAGDFSAGGTMISAGDMEFIQQCVSNVVGEGTITIDCTAVAEARGQANARSIANRISNIRKKYNLPFFAGNTNGELFNANSGETGSSPAKKTATPKKGGAGTKRKATGTPKKSNKKIKAEDSAEADADADAADEDAGDELKAEAKSSGDEFSQDKEKETSRGSGFTAINVPKAKPEEGSEEALYEKYEEYTADEENSKRD